MELDKERLAGIAAGEEGKGVGGKKKKAPGPGRGPSKASVLGKALGLIRWLDSGNEWLEGEVRRLEGDGR
jgi:hypothetical protein